MKPHPIRLLAPIAVAAALAFTVTFSCGSAAAPGADAHTVWFTPPGSEPPYTSPQNPEQEAPTPESPLPTPDPARAPHVSAPVTDNVPITDAAPAPPEQPEAPVAPVELAPPPPPLTADQLLNTTVIAPSYSPTSTIQLVNGS